ncbi:MAG: class I SAM-dependent methyltransferase, partial [Phycisphaerae bacterium]|nr:class I SAM-dependent methyltransferase [Phycisphaerae bacterium]
MTTLERPPVALPKNPLPRQQYTFFPTFADRPHPTRWEFPAYLDNPGCRWLQCLKEMYAMPIAFPSSLSPEAGLMLHALVRNLRPRVVVEVGTYLSISTHWIASALKENADGGVVHCFDDFGPIHKGPWRDAEMLEGRLDWVKERLTKAGLIDLVRFHPGDSSTQIIAERGQLAFEGGIDVALIDGDHSVPGACKDLWA